MVVCNRAHRVRRLVAWEFESKDEGDDEAPGEGMASTILQNNGTVESATVDVKSDSMLEDITDDDNADDEGEEQDVDESSDDESELKILPVQAIWMLLSTSGEDWLEVGIVTVNFEY
uniref:Uncharacterized protein n=1 Tax=Anopheles culicifacies TaxID=139723 RepID=A0A182MHA3_9DIPT